MQRPLRDPERDRSWRKESEEWREKEKLAKEARAAQIQAAKAAKAAERLAYKAAHPPKSESERSSKKRRLRKRGLVALRVLTPIVGASPVLIEEGLLNWWDAENRSAIAEAVSLTFLTWLNRRGEEMPADPAPRVTGPVCEPSRNKHGPPVPARLRMTKMRRLRKSGLVALWVLVPIVEASAALVEEGRLQWSDAENREAVASALSAVFKEWFERHRRRHWVERPHRQSVGVWDGI